MEDVPKTFMGNYGYLRKFRKILNLFLKYLKGRQGPFYEKQLTDLTKIAMKRGIYEDGDV